MSIPLTELLNVGQTMIIDLLSYHAVQAIKVTNKSPYDVQYSGFSVSGTDWIAAGTEYMLYATPTGNNGTLSLTAYNTTNVLPANPGAVLLVIYQPGEILPSGNWPVSIPFQTVTANGTLISANQLINTGNPVVTNVASIQSATAATPAISLNNDGSGFFKVENAGVLTTLIQLIAGASPALKLAAASIIIEALGGLKVDQTFESVGNALLDGTLTVVGATSLDNGSIVTSGGGNYTASTASGATISLQKSNVTYLELLDNGNGPSLDVPTGQNATVSINGTSVAFANHSNNRWTATTGFGLVVGSLSRLVGGNGTSCGTNTVISHGMGTSPDALVLTPNGGASFSATIGIDGIGSSTFTATVGAGSAICWMAVKA